LAKRLGTGVETVAGDLCDPITIERLVPEGAEPDIVVHAAGHRFAYAKLHAEEAAEADLFGRGDYEGVAPDVRRAAPAMMARRWGRIVAVTSIAAAVAGAGSARYTSTKSAVEGLVRALAVDYGRYGITANAVAPGFVATERLISRAGAVEKLEA